MMDRKAALRNPTPTKTPTTRRMLRRTRCRGDNSDNDNSMPKRSRTDSGDISSSKIQYLSQIMKVKDMFSTGEHMRKMEFLANLESLNTTYLDIYEKYPVQAKSVLGEAINVLVEHGVDSIMLTIMAESLSMTCDSVANLTDLERNILNETVKSFRRFADHSFRLSATMCKKADMLEITAEALLFHGYFHYDPNSQKVNLLRNLLCLVYVCSLHSTNSTRLREVGLIGTLKRVARCKDTPAAFMATLALAGFLNEEESKFFHSQTRTMKHLLGLLNEGIESPLEPSYGWTTTELAVACRRLAVNDVNKETLVDLGILKHLVRLCSGGKKAEKKEALGALWTLAFLDTNKVKMVQEKNLIETLVRLRRSKDDRLKTQSINSLWTLKEGLLMSPNPKFKTLGEELSTSVKQMSNSEHKALTSGKHIMISYNWDNQEIVSKLHGRLRKAGYQLWLDKDRMTGSIIECIANGVENADVMLICISQKYKNSGYCRSEAEYAFNLKIPIIPLVMDYGYKADGWLGLIIGTKLYFNFCEEESFDELFDALAKEIGNKGKCLIETETFPHGGIGSHGTGELDLGKRAVVNWSTEETRKWLQDNDCVSESLEKITRKQLLFLKNLKEKAPEFFYNYLRTELNLEDLSSLANFVDALDSL